MQSPVRTKCAKNAGAMSTLVVDRFIVVCCSFLLFINGVGVSSVTKRCVHRGEAVKLFLDTGGKCDVVSMYMYDKTELWIASWSLRDDVTKIEHMDADYSKKIYMDGNRNVWFLDVAKTDAGKYVFKCGIQIEQLDLELTVLDKLTEEQLQECPDKCPGVSKMEIETMTTVQYMERYTKGVRHYTNTDVRKGDDREGVRHYTNTDVRKGDDREGSHSDTDHRITVILVIVIIMGIFLLVLIMGIGIWFACNMWNKTKSWSEDQVQKCLHDHPGFMEKRLEKLTDDQMLEQIQKYLLGVFPMLIEKCLGKLTESQIEELIQKGLVVYPGPLFIEKYLGRLPDEQVRKWLMDRPALTAKQNSTEDHGTISSQVTPSIVPADYGVDDRLNEVESVEEENQFESSVQDKIIMFEQKCSPNEQPKLNKLQKKNLRIDRGFTSEDCTNPLLES